MNKTTKTAWAALILTAFIAQTAYAATYSMSISNVAFTETSPYSKDLYTQIGFTYSSPSGVSVTNCQAKVTSIPSGWGVRDNYDINYKTLPSCSGTATFEIQPTTTGTYDGSVIIIEVRGSSTGGDTINPATGSPTGTIEVKNQPVLNLEIISVPAAINGGTTAAVQYRLTNIGDAQTASTSNLRLAITTTPSNSLSYQDGTGSAIISGGTLAAGAQITGTLNIQPAAGATDNGNITFTLRATADNTAQEDTGSRTIQCVNCLQAITYRTIMFGGWNLISLPIATFN
ncbi:Uncharacterised protein [uncultured archaeon]|nr:Uncharacterised protein [uncultured archaeon]